MNTAVEEGDFRGGLEGLLERIADSENRLAQNPYDNAKTKKFVEYDTRTFFFDHLLKLLGWHLDIDGDVREEARIKADTTKRIDYLGINEATQAPVLILEAKAWDKPFISGKGENQEKNPNELVIKAIQHIRDGKSRETAPVVGDWYDYLSQLTNYVKTSKDYYGHRVPRAVLASGKWLIVFTNPATTFCDGEIDKRQFQIFYMNEYVTKADTIYRLLAKKHLAKVTPEHIRPSQLGTYFTAKTVSAVFYSILVNYEKPGLDFFLPLPLIQIYPALIVQREDDALFTVTNERLPIEMKLTKDNTGKDSLVDHINSVMNASQTLLKDCSAELGMTLTAFNINDFQGFPDEDIKNVNPILKPKIKFVKPIKTSADQWLVATGDVAHFLLKQPDVTCQFHEWSNCNNVGKGIEGSPVSSQKTKTPRSFFKDGMVYHCAHQTVQDRRESRCHIAPIDMRTCCRACVFQYSCWSKNELLNLPCGS